ncbi:MAG: patatin-like phospholipase family protein [Planctomycetia bacterium]
MSDDQKPKIREGIALCLSGGGYRAMMFHVGVLIRLNELGVMKKLARISSVSGGSITAAVLGMNWKKLTFDKNGVATNLKELLTNPIQKMAATSVDTQSVLGGVFWRGCVSDWVASRYAEILFDHSTLQDFPDDSEGPRFILHATNVQSGALLRMSKPYVADYRVGMIRNMKLPLATAVAASSAFPPFLSPMTIDVNPSDFVPDPTCDLQRLPFTDTFVLCDGGVYDNLGMETIWKQYRTLLVSDAGAKIAPEGDPASDWAQHSKRIMEIVDDQVRNLRKRLLLNLLTSQERFGGYWSVRSDIRNYGLPDAIPCDFGRTTELANTPTRLKKMSELLQKQLVNWGYAVCDAGVRKHAANLPTTAAPARFPFAEAGV